MRAIRLHRFGTPDGLVLDDLPDLEPGPGEVRVAVAAAGVHLLDTSLRRGEAGPLPLPELPTVPGREVAGVVDAVGPGTERTWLGRRVVAHLGQVPGGYAEQAVTAATSLFEVPDHVPWPDAVTAVGTGRTALGVLETEPPRADDVVLVPSAAGGLGWLLAQGALAAGATVVAAASRPAALADLGAHLVVDYTEPGWAERVRSDLGGVTLVLDGVGGEVGRAALELLRPGGRHVLLGWSSGTPTDITTGDLVRLGVTAGWALGARMQALPGGIPGLAARAHADLEGRRALGKVVLLTGGER